MQLMWRKSRKHRPSWCVISTAIALTLMVACASDDSADTASGDGSPSVMEGTSAPYTPPPSDDLGEKRSILRVLANDGRFDILTSIVLERTVFARDTMGGPECCLTLFAPVDEAFQKLPEDELDAIIQDPKRLTPLIQRHILPGTVYAKRLETRVYTSTGQGFDIPIEVKGKRISVANARVLERDIKASNGVIHAIDALIMVP